MDLEGKNALFAIARAALEKRLGLPSAGHRPPLGARAVPPGLFLALYLKNEPRACVGNVIMHDTLPETLARLAREAAFEDSRFPPLSARDYPDLHLELHLLSPLKRVFHLEDITPGLHGVYIQKGVLNGVLLPRVWKELPDRDDFMNALCRQKAGLPRNSWADPEAEMYVFTVETLSERERP